MLMKAFETPDASDRLHPLIISGEDLPGIGTPLVTTARGQGVRAHDTCYRPRYPLVSIICIGSL